MDVYAYFSEGFATGLDRLKRAIETKNVLKNTTRSKWTLSFESSVDYITIEAASYIEDLNRGPGLGNLIKANL